MYWENPNALFLLWILPAAGALFIYAFRKRAATARRFADQAMVARLMPSFRGARPWIKGIFVLAGIGCLVVATARPRFGYYFEHVKQRGVDLFVLLDVSRSMLAEDVAPNRLERARSDIRDLLKQLTGDRTGLVAFAGKPVVMVPLTTDQGFFKTVLNETGPSSAPRGGSLIGDAIRKGMEAMKERRDRDQVFVLITDGEDHDSFPEEAAKRAAERGIKIFCVGLGDPGDGARIPVRKDENSLVYIKHQGKEVWSSMDEDLLKKIALSTGGAYIPAKTSAYDLGEVYDNHLAGLAKGEIREEKRKRFKERFQLFVCLGVLFLLADMLTPVFRKKTISRETAEVKQ